MNAIKICIRKIGAVFVCACLLLIPVNSISASEMSEGVDFCSVIDGDTILVVGTITSINVEWKDSVMGGVVVGSKNLSDYCSSKKSSRVERVYFSVADAREYNESGYTISNGSDFVIMQSTNGTCRIEKTLLNKIGRKSLFFLKSSKMLKNGGYVYIGKEFSGPVKNKPINWADYDHDLYQFIQDKNLLGFIKNCKRGS